MERMKTRIEHLEHHTLPLSHSGKVVVLDQGAVLDAETTAMLQALHSRSVGGINEHLKVLAEKGADKFMSSFYVGYGHKSIGDCGTAIVFIEGVSMLAAKALQDYQLYNGQEASTRYIDFASQPFINPCQDKNGEIILETWRSFYLKAKPLVIADLTKRFPQPNGEPDKKYQKAIEARAFDICRGFLPAGASTNLAWTGTLRGFADRLLQLRHHPLAEVREIGEVLENALIATYENSFTKEVKNATDTAREKVRYPQTESYVELTMQDYYYHDPDTPELALAHDGVDHASLTAYRELLENRPAKTELPKWLGAYGTAAFAFTLDFGSYRDIQRQRAVVQRMPLLTAELGFHEWYLSELPESLREEANVLLEQQQAALIALELDRFEQQYYLPMGYNISNYLSGDVPALVYLVELRATSVVHPTLAKRAGDMANLMLTAFGEDGLSLHLDPDPGRFNIKRGEHDITLKE